MLNPTLLIAATIDDDGQIVLPAAQQGIASALVKAYFSIGEHGRLVQHVAPQGAPGAGTKPGGAPLDMTFFAACLSRQFGELTPSLFALRGFAATGGVHGKLLHADDAAERERYRILRNAFLVHLAAHEDRLA